MNKTSTVKTVEALRDRLKTECNYYVNGQCTTTYCLLRGGWRRGKTPVDYNLATCEIREEVEALEDLLV